MTSKNSTLWMAWLDWYTGERICYRVFKSGRRIVLHGPPSTLPYEIGN